MSGKQSETVRKIRDLNDAFRKTGIDGRIMLTIGIRELGEPAINQIITKVRNFADFNKNNDPFGEHDLGSITHNGVKVLWKVDCVPQALA